MNWTHILQQIPFHHLEDRANQILDALKIQSPEQLNLRKIARYFKFPVHFRPENSSAQRFGDNYLIIVDSRLTLEERREKLAEEICHCLLPMGNQLLQKEQETNKQENLALRMAAYLLIPRRSLLTLHIPDDETMAIEYLSHVFKVSPFMIRYRFELDHKQWLVYRQNENDTYQVSSNFYQPYRIAEERPGYKINRFTCPAPCDCFQITKPNGTQTTRKIIRW
jgi:Zn-dependent peptidase ImmA (M78 family)